MIEITVKRAAVTRGVRTPAELARRMGVKDAMAGRLWEGTHNATLKTIDAVCAALKCELKDILKYTPNGIRRPERARGARRRRAR